LYNASESFSSQKKWTPSAVQKGKAHDRHFEDTVWRDADEEAFDSDEQLFHALGDFSIEKIQPISHPLPKDILSALNAFEKAQIKKAAKVREDQQKEEARKGPMSLDAKGDESENAHLPFVPLAIQEVGWDGKPVQNSKSTPFEINEVEAVDEVLSEEIEPELEASYDEASSDEVSIEDQACAQDPTCVEMTESIEIHSADTLQESEKEEAVEIELHEESSAAQQLPCEEEIAEEVKAKDPSQDTPEDVNEDEALLAQQDDLAQQVQADDLPQAVEQEVAPEVNESDLPLEDEQLQKASHDIEDWQEEHQESPPQEEVIPVIQGVSEQEVMEREQSHFLRGLEEGKRQIRQEMAQKVQDQCQVLAGVSDQLNALLQNSGKLYEPLRRLSLHIAKQLVAGEISQPVAVIERLVQRCLDEVNLPVQGLVTVQVSEQDRAFLNERDSALFQGMRIETDSQLLPASVRVLVNDMVIEDFAKNRMSSVVHALQLSDAPIFNQDDQTPVSDASSETSIESGD
jgi:hypothetical protein